MSIDISEAIELFEGLADMMEGEVARSKAPRSQYEHQRMLSLVRSRAVAALLECIAADSSHPVVYAVRKHISVFSPTMHSLEDAEGVRKWANSNELQEKADLWAELAALPEEYAAEVLA